MTEAPYPSSRTAWTMVTLLTLAYVFSFVDRYILGLLIEPIKADLHFSDEKIGYLLGPAFALFYATIGVPLGWLADRARRTWIVAAGITLWSIATAASGLARGFGGLFVARMSVGVGEATLSPSAMSMISDSFPREKRGTPIGVYSAALSLGAGIASLIGAAVLGWAKVSSGMTLPILGAVKPWQFAFLAVGLPGLLIAIGFLLLPEPPRRRGPGNAQAAGFGATIALVGKRLGAFGGMTSLVAVMTIIAYSQGFNPAAFARSFGWEARDYALVNGSMILILGPATVYGAGAIIDRWRKRGTPDAAFRMLTMGFIVMLPASAVPLFMPSPWLAFAILGVSTTAIGTVTAAGIIALLDITPGASRATIVSLYYMMISIAGLGLGPTTVGLLSTRVFGEGQLRAAVGAVPLIYGLVPLLLLPMIAKAYRAQLSRAP
ncbi:MFS transporter [Sphingomonas sp. 28-63-12]|uniref:MFS transporter n=1 Tax=Sphingomonas sp. 28-63-12 TaxID=1970434 RepID=UPI000BDC9040|nr:MAG: hypothetical protein B7Y47_00915 [Sphingomonas sp. 28-63-12]